MDTPNLKKPDGMNIKDEKDFPQNDSDETQPGAFYMVYDLYRCLNPPKKTAKAIVALLVVIMASAMVFARPANDYSATKVAPIARSDVRLDNKAAARLIKKLYSRLPAFIDDKATRIAIGQKWRSHADLGGKTKQEILDMLFQDVFSLVKDDETLEGIWKSWGGDKSDTANTANRKVCY